MPLKKPFEKLHERKLYPTTEPKHHVESLRTLVTDIKDTNLKSMDSSDLNNLKRRLIDESTRIASELNFDPAYSRYYGTLHFVGVDISKLLGKIEELIREKESR